MDTREAIDAELDTASEAVLQEVFNYVRFIKSKASFPDSAFPESRYIPDFLARQKAMFGDRIFSDSQEILDDIRGDRF